MKKIILSIYKLLQKLGFDLFKSKSKWVRYIVYLIDLKKLKAQQKQKSNFTIIKRPILNDKFDTSGIMSGHYFHQDLLVAKKIFKNNPEKHIDIGSRTDGFVAHVAVFRKIEIFDIRPQQSSIENISFKQVDLMKLPENLINYTDSISSLHAIEHFGLGRYNDPIDFYGHEKALNNIYKILKTNGIFYFSVPIGPQRIEFNAHRVFNLNYLINLFSNKYTIKSFSYIDDNGYLHNDTELTEKNIKNNCDCSYGCGIFELLKK